jgi:hypothetical protein
MTLLGKATPVSNAPVVIQESQTTVSNPAMQAAELFFNSGLFPNAKNVAGVFTIVEYGKEVGIPPVVALQNISIVKGKLCMGGQAMLALARKHGVKAKVEEESEEKCAIHFQRDEEEYHAIFTIEDAKQAGLSEKDNWQMYTKDMLKWRAVAKGCRFIAPDLLGGIYLPEEIENLPTRTTEEKQRVELPAPQENEKVEEKITDAQVRRLHTMLSNSGLILFKSVLRDYLYDKGLVDETKSSKTLRRGDAEAIMDNYDMFERKFYANDDYADKLKAVFTLLDKLKKVTILNGLRKKVRDGDSIPSANTEMEDTMLNDYFSLFLVANHNEVHNVVADKAEAAGMTVDEAIGELSSLGLKPEVKEHIELPQEEEQGELF